MKHLLLLLMIPFTFSGGAEQVDLGEYKDLKTPKIEEKVVEIKDDHTDNCNICARTFNFLNRIYIL